MHVSDELLWELTMQEYNRAHNTCASVPSLHPSGSDLLSLVAWYVLAKQPWTQVWQALGGMEAEHMHRCSEAARQGMPAPPPPPHCVLPASAESVQPPGNPRWVRCGVVKF